MSPITFSIVIETANLAISDLTYLKSAMDALYGQTLQASNAKEVVVVDIGILPLEEIQSVCAPYPNFQVVRAEGISDYYLTKAEGFKHVTGDVVVFIDADCDYESIWLENLLRPFEDKNIKIVTGETWHRIQNPYDLAVGLLWTFRPFTYGSQLTEIPYYYSNNVAFRREILLEIPLMGSGKYHRTGQSEHIQVLRQHGIKIWMQPSARSYHQVPRLKYIFSIMFSEGSDARLLTKQGKNLLGKNRLWRTRATRFTKKFGYLLANNKLYYAYLPFALPFCVVMFISYLCGYAYRKMVG